MQKTALSLFLSLLVISTHSIKAQENADDSFRLGDQTWVYAGTTSSGESSYIPVGENSNDWDEVIIFYHVPSGDVDLSEYYETFMQILNRRSGDLFQSKEILSDDNSIIFAWWTTPGKGESQQGAVKISKMPSGLKFFRYTTKGTEDKSDQIKKWEKILADTEIDMSLEKLEILFPWNFQKAEWKAVVESPSLYEYIPENETPDNWNEKVSIHVWSTLPLPLNDFYQLVIEDLQSRLEGNIEHRILQLSDTELFFEWWIDKGPDARHEWYKLQVAGPKLAVVTRYTTKDLRDLDSKRKTWENILKNAAVEADYRYIVVPKSFSKTENWNQGPISTSIIFL